MARKQTISADDGVLDPTIDYATQLAAIDAELEAQGSAPPPRPRRRRGRTLIRFLFWVLLPLGLAWAAGLVVFAGGIDESGTVSADPTDAIVVLTGGQERISTGFDLLDRGFANRMLISGVYDGVEVGTILRLAQADPNDMACCVELGHMAESTRGNAQETKDFLEKNGFQSVRVVTASYHMRRSLLEMRTAIVDREIVPHPVPRPNLRLSEWWRHSGTVHLLSVEYSKYLLAHARIGGGHVADAAGGFAREHGGDLWFDIRLWWEDVTAGISLPDIG